MRRRKVMKPKTRSAAKALLRMGQNRAEVKRRLRASGVSDDDLKSAEAEVQLEAGLDPDAEAALRALKAQMLPESGLPKSSGGKRGPYKKANPQHDLKILRRALRKGLPLDERAAILVDLAKADEPAIAIKALSLINDLDALTHASKAQGERPAPGPMWILPADAIPSVDPVHVGGLTPDSGGGTMPSAVASPVPLPTNAAPDVAPEPG